MSTASTDEPANGLAILIKAPNTVRTFIPREGETITITDKQGKELWSIRVPVPNKDPGVTIYNVQIDLLTERDFGNFAQKTWTRGLEDPPPKPPTPPANPTL